MGADARSSWRRLWRDLCSCTTAGPQDDGKRIAESEDSDSTFERAIPKHLATANTAPTAIVPGSDAGEGDHGLSRKANRQLQLHEVGAQYRLEDADVPLLQHAGEVLIKVQAIGLNPIDWKSPKFGFGIPKMPFVSGREFVGTVEDWSELDRSDLKAGDVVLSVSTDYRDYRKAAFQSYAVASNFNTLRVPSHVPIESVAGIGVAFVVAAISLGINFGSIFPDPDVEEGLDLLILARSQPKPSIPEDIWNEIFDGIRQDDRIKKGDWILIYGASAITGQMAVQLAKLAGLKVIAVADAARHTSRLAAIGADLVVDRHDLDAAEAIITKVTNGDLRFAIDAVGKDTADWSHRLLHRLSLPRSSDLDSPAPAKHKAHLVGLSGLPKELEPSVRGHSVPVKIFHSNAVLGRSIMLWLQDLLAEGKLQLPDIDIVSGGLASINGGLERLERGEASGKRIIVSMSQK